MATPERPETATRFYSLDALRATAMLLGVLWHAGPGFGSGIFPALMEWLHSFRMPLFMLISGFFGCMMLEKYGLVGYLRRRWWRIGLPMLVGLFTFMPLYHKYGPMAGMMPDFARFPPPGTEAPPGGPPDPGGPRGFPGFPPPGAQMPPLPGGPGGRPGFTPGVIPPPFKPFDADNDGSLSPEEMRKASESLFSGGPNGRGPGGPPGFGSENPLNRRLFGDTGRLFSLGHLWFLWYLLVFVTAAPLISWPFGQLVSRAGPAIERVRISLVSFGLAPLVLGLVSLPLLFPARGFSGWGLGLASGIGGHFPDFFFQYQKDWPFYFAYFMTGWCLYSMRHLLSTVSRQWPVTLLGGIAAYVIAQWFSGRFASQTQLPNYATLEVLGFGLFALAAAYTSWGFLGLFERYLNRPTRWGAYFTELALWIYLVHQDLLGPINRGLRAMQISGVPQVLLATLLAIIVAAVLYELIIRPTPLIWVFGPGRRPPKRDTPTQGTVSLNT